MTEEKHDAEMEKEEGSDEEYDPANNQEDDGDATGSESEEASDADGEGEGDEAEAPPKKKGAKTKEKKASVEGKRPKLNKTPNALFKEQYAAEYKAAGKPKLSFGDMSKLMSKEWAKVTDPKVLGELEKRAIADKKRYEKEMAEWKEKFPEKAAEYEAKKADRSKKAKKKKKKSLMPKKAKAKGEKRKKKEEGSDGEEVEQPKKKKQRKAPAAKKKAKKVKGFVPYAASRDLGSDQDIE